MVGGHTSYKALRGLNDPFIGCLLIPADGVHQWDADPDGYVHLSFLVQVSAHGSCPARDPTINLGTS